MNSQQPLGHENIPEKRSSPPVVDIVAVTEPAPVNPPKTIKPSYAPVYSSPPPIAQPYNPKNALDDLPGLSYALELFLAKHMVECEDYCNKNDEKK